MSVTKTDLAEALYMDVGLNKCEANEFVDAFFNSIKDILVDGKDINTSDVQIKSALMDLQRPVYVAKTSSGYGVANTTNAQGENKVLAFAQSLTAKDLGDDAFKKQHGVKYAYHGGAMANGIASVELVVALGKAGFLCSFGAAGLVPDAVEDAIKRIQAELPQGPFAVNLIHAPAEEALERGAVERFIKLGVNTVEASAYLGLTCLLYTSPSPRD